jgi:hypothetical protein
MNFWMLISSLCILSLAGCTNTVQPWERGTLAKPEMAFDPNTSELAIRNHTFSAKEASTGGYGVSGGGCGCN